MPLAAQQSSFMRALLATADEPTTVLADIHGGVFSPAERLSIYRNNLRENFLKVLELEFPVIKKLVGDDFFRQTARQYLAHAPSRSGDLLHCGRQFPQFLREQFGNGDYAYLPDVAALEWAYQEAMIAADDTQVFDLAGLANIAPDDYDQLTLQPHPAMRLLRSPWPIVAIWNANQPGAAVDIQIDVSRGGENALLTRPLRSTGIATVSPGAAAFLQATLERVALGAALASALNADPDFDLQSALGPWIENRVFVSWLLA